MPDTEYSKAMEQLSYVNGQIQESADASSVVTTVDDETIRVYAVDEVIPKEEEEILTHPSLPPSKDGPQYTSSPYAYKGKNAIDFNFWDVQVWLSKTTVGAMIVGTTAAAVFILNKRFPSMSNTVAWAVATAVGGYLAEKAARAMYLKVSYFGGIKEVRFF